VGFFHSIRGWWGTGKLKGSALTVRISQGCTRRLTRLGPQDLLSAVRPRTALAAETIAAFFLYPGTRKPKRREDAAHSKARWLGRNGGGREKVGSDDAEPSIILKWRARPGQVPEARAERRGMGRATAGAGGSGKITAGNTVRELGAAGGQMVGKMGCFLIIYAL
jgi:hypothetical protein